MVTILAEPSPGSTAAVALPATVELPAGLIGFPELTRFDLFPADDRGPFLWLRPQSGNDPVTGFLVLDPAGWIADYQLQLFDEDAAWLALDEANPPWVFNIVTLSPDEPALATINLLGPVVVRRGDGVGKQIILANHQQYSATQPLVSERGN